MNRVFSTLLLLLAFAYGNAQQKNFSVYVNPFVGTDGHGHTFPGATRPFGMVQVSPDTRVDGSWDGCSGYHYSDTIIYGFSHTHLSGTGVSDYGDILLMPISGEPSFDNKKYRTSFSHQNESATAGYYAVSMNNGIKVELTSTTRVGFHKYVFPQGITSVVLDLVHRDNVLESNIRIINNKTIAVRRRSSAWASDQHAYGYILFSKPFTYIFNEEKNKVMLDFKLQSKEALYIKLGFSMVDEDGAMKNIQAELPHWDFTRIKNEARAAWNKELGKIEVTDGDVEKLRTFYTALYHVMVQPNVANDVDGRYRGRDNKIHTAEGFSYYTVFSLWDTFRAEHPLLTLIDRKRTLDFIKTFLLQYQQGGRLPVWELASNETDCMIGYHSVSVIADAMAKGIKGFDAELAFEAMKKSATWKHLGLPDYIRQGFLYVEDEHESVSKTLEYAYDDWCIAQGAKLLNKNEDYLTYMSRSQSWKNLLDPETNLMRPRKNGDWLSPFDPREVNNHFTEGNSWQYSFFVPQDIYGMLDLMGGPVVFEEKLDELFSSSTETTGRKQVDISGLIGQYAHGNEPSHHMAYLYHYLGKPHKTQQRVFQILDKFYSSRADGLIGNEDCGQMSAWYVLSALGLYQISPGTDYFILNAPYVQKVVIHLENKNIFTINGNNLSRENNYRSNISLNREPLGNNSILSYETIMKGGVLSVGMSDLPEKELIAGFPPRQESIASIVAVPLISAPTRAFKDSLLVSITAPHGNHKIFYTIDGSEPGLQSKNYVGSFMLHNTASIKAVAADDEEKLSKIASAQYFKKQNNYSVSLVSKYSPQYSAGGDEGLIDGIRGDINWRKGDWQGYTRQDFEAVINLKQKKTIKKLSAGFLQDTRSWILMPTRVEFYSSDDGHEFALIGEVENTLEDKDYQSKIRDFSLSIDKPLNTHFIKVIAYNYGKLPEWHFGAGGNAFIFIDEIIIE